jgi:hypothetical protein
MPILSAKALTESFNKASLDDSGSNQTVKWDNFVDSVYDMTNLNTPPNRLRCQSPPPVIHRKSGSPVSILQDYPMENEDDEALWLTKALSSTSTKFPGQSSPNQKTASLPHPCIQSIVEKAMDLMDSAMELDRVIKAELKLKKNN